MPDLSGAPAFKNSVLRIQAINGYTTAHEKYHNVINDGANSAIVTNFTTPF
jgi:hypothetical protein